MEDTSFFEASGIGRKEYPDSGIVVEPGKEFLPLDARDPSVQVLVPDTLAVPVFVIGPLKRNGFLQKIVVLGP